MNTRKQPRIQSCARATALIGMLAAAAGAQHTERVSVNSIGFTGDGYSRNATVSGDGRYVAFQSHSTTFHAPDVNSTGDVFVKDRLNGQLICASVALSGSTGGGQSYNPAFSSGGRYLAFDSYANDLVPGDQGLRDVFVYDLETATIERVSVSSSEVPANGHSTYASISGDGRFVAFASFGTNLVPGDVNGNQDIFVRDRVLGTTEIVSLASGGAQVNGNSGNPDISADGRFVAFDSLASNAVVGDTNGVYDIFVRDRYLGVTERVSLWGGVNQASDDSRRPSISGDGRYVAFETDDQFFGGDTNLVSDVAVFDRLLGSSFLVSKTSNGGAGNFSSFGPEISDHDPVWVAFESDATNLVNSDTNNSRDVFLRRIVNPTTYRVSVTSSGAEGHGLSWGAALSGDGRHTAFSSSAPDLVGGHNGFEEVYVHNTWFFPPYPEVYCSGKPNSAGCVPFFDVDGSPSASDSQPFDVHARDLVPNQAGFLIYGTAGKSFLPFHGGTLCVKLPYTRFMPLQKSGQSGTPPCSGVFTRDFNKRIQSGADPTLTFGQTVHMQWYQRDPQDPAGFGDSLSNALEFTIGP